MYRKLNKTNKACQNINLILYIFKIIKLSIINNILN